MIANVRSDLCDIACPDCAGTGKLALPSPEPSDQGETSEDRRVMTTMQAIQRGLAAEREKGYRQAAEDCIDSLCEHGGHGKGEFLRVADFLRDRFLLGCGRVGAPARARHSFPESTRFESHSPGNEGAEERCRVTYDCRFNNATYAEPCDRCEHFQEER